MFSFSLEFNDLCSLIGGRCLCSPVFINGKLQEFDILLRSPFLGIVVSLVSGKMNP